MDRRTKDTLRGGVAAFGVATGLLALATTAQTPDGYIHASFGGPLDVFSSDTADVLSIGDGANDAGELATLLKGPVGPAAKVGAADSPYRVAYEAGAAPNATTGAPTAMPSSTPIIGGPLPDGKEPPLLPSKPVVDAQGRIDCTGAVSCKTDPATNVTTVTYPDGVIAVVQKINDLTVVAYKTITEALPSEIATLLPPAPEAPPVLAAVAPTAASTPSVAPPGPSTAPSPAPAPAPAPTPVLQTPAPPTTAPPPETEDDDPAPSIDPTPPKDTGQSGAGSIGPSPSSAPRPKLPDKVKDALGGIADTVKGAMDSVGKALNPGASTKPGNPGKPGESGGSGQSGDHGKSGSRSGQDDSEG